MVLECGRVEAASQPASAGTSTASAPNSMRRLQRVTITPSSDYAGRTVGNRSGAAGRG